MQHRTLRRVVLSFAVVIVAVGSLTLLGCGGGGEDLRNVSADIPLNAANAGNGSTSVVNGQTFAGVSGAVLAQNARPALPAASPLAGQTASLGFSGVSGSTGNFALTAPSVTASGPVAFASCTFTVQTTSNAAVLPVGTVITISNCVVTVTATGVEVGNTTGTTGTITLSLNGVSSTPNNTTVELQDNGTLVIVNPGGVIIVTTVIVTGTSGG